MPITAFLNDQALRLSFEINTILAQSSLVNKTFSNPTNCMQEYSEISTIAGLVYIFMPDQRFAGRFFWTLLIILMLILGLYWSLFLYNNWDDNPVTTTVATTGACNRLLNQRCLSLNEKFFIQILTLIFTILSMVRQMVRLGLS